MGRLQPLILSSVLLLAPASMTAAFAQGASAGSQAPGPAAAPATPVGQTGSVGSTAMVPPAKNGPANTGMVRQDSPDSPSAQLQNPTGAQPGTGSGMGKVSGTAAGN